MNGPMTIADIRRYLRETLEFFLYFVFMTVLGAAMYVLVDYAPQANSRWYINTCIAMAVLTGLYALRMLGRYRRAMQRLAALPDNFVVSGKPGHGQEVVTLQWSERIASERLESQGGDPERVRLLEKLEAVEQAYREHCADHDAVPEEASSVIDPSMSLEAIRRRLAERVMLLTEAEERFAKPPIFRS